MPIFFAEGAAWEQERQQLLASWRGAAAKASPVASQQQHRLEDAIAWRRREQQLLAQLREARRGEGAGARGSPAGA